MKSIHIPPVRFDDPRSCRTYQCPRDSFFSVSFGNVSASAVKCPQKMITYVQTLRIRFATMLPISTVRKNGPASAGNST